MNTATVLVVEDDEAFRRTMTRALHGAGYAVEAVGDGAAALALLDRASYDLVVSDVTMPGVGGVELLRAVRRRDRDLPVILMTGNPAIETAAEAVELGALRYLMKPLELAQLRLVAAIAIDQYREVCALRRQRAGSTAEDLVLTSSFSRALETLRMAYQPIVRPTTREVYAYEALVRPVEPGLGNPGLLFAAAERLGRIAEVGRVVRDRVAAQIRDAPCELVFVNLHPLELCDEELYSPSAALSRVAGRVVLEITERAALEELGDVPVRIARLRALGYRLAVDDLGAGYSSLSSIAQLEPEVVKLDMSLVRGVDCAPTKQRLLQSLVELFGKLGREVVAEGVETAEEARTLAGLGCQLFQGYFFARPDLLFKAPTW